MTSLAEPGRWREVRRTLDAHRHELAELASARYADLEHVGPTRLLGRPEWLPAAPVELSEVGLEWVPEPVPPVVDGSGPTTAHLRPNDERTGEPFASYADAIGALAPPTVFENRPAYRLLSADLGTPAPWLRFGPGAYFDGVNVGEAAAHELADAWAAGQDLASTVLARGGRPPHPRSHLRREPPPPAVSAMLPLRSAVGDPRDLARRPALPAISTLTIRHDEAAGRASFVLHWRDPAKVAHAGGLYQVMPVGVFQPVSRSGCALDEDFDLWRSMVREFSEELLGASEEYGEQDELDYAAWPFYRDITAARAEGWIQVSCLGIGVDPLTWATDILTVAVFDADCFDELFAGLVDANAEGKAITMPFDDATLTPLVDGTEPTQAAGAAVLALARRFRDQLLATA